jgi:ubiquinone/menaquinone biosynthesis C-methylase UbiE
MDLTNVDFKQLAPQLRKPEGAFGLQVAQVMAEKNKEVTIFTLQCVQIAPADRVLEIGFGHGEGIAMALQQASEGFVAGIDFSPDMVDMATKKNTTTIIEERCALTCGEASDMPFGDESFDKIFAVNVFHFWEHPEKELKECMRVLKCGGCMAFFMALPECYQQGLRDSGVFIVRSPEEVEAMLKNIGCTNVEHQIVTVVDFKGFAAIGEKK